MIPIEKSDLIRESIKDPGTQMYILANGETYLNSLSELVENLVMGEKRKGLFLSTIWSANALSRRLSLSKLPKGSLKIIDTYSMNLGSSYKDREDFIFLATPVPLEMILAEIERLVSKKEGQFSFLIVDSLTTMKREYSPGQISEFFKYILSRTLEEEMKIVVFDQDPDSVSGVYREVSSTMDGVLDLRDGGD